jgi:bifunctional DNA primase/polymerase-like protein
MEEGPGKAPVPEAAEASTSIVDALLSVDKATDRPFAEGAPALASAGLYVFPLDSRKKPLVKWGSEATTDQQVIAEWAKRWPNAGIGIACKPSGLLVVDLDVKHPPVSGPDNWAEVTLASGDPEAAPACYYDRTTLIRSSSGGYHAWFANPEGIPGRDDMLPGIDVKAAQGYCGGFVVAPPTPGYEVLGLKPPMPVPESLALILTHDDKPQVLRPNDPFTAPSTGNLIGLIRAVLDAPEGNRNATLHWCGCRAYEAVFAGLVQEGSAVAALTEAAECTGLRHDEIAATLRSARNTVARGVA